MKRIVALLLTLLLAIPSIVGADATQKRGLVELVELYMQRAIGYKQSHNSEDILTSSLHADPFISDGFLVVQANAGSITVDPNDSYNVHDVLMILSSDKNSESKNRNLALRAAITVSVLEYDEQQDASLRLRGNDPVEIAIYIVYEKIIGTSAKTATQAEERVKVYSGNYDYFVGYKEPFVYLYAEAHE